MSTNPFTTGGYGDFSAFDSSENKANFSQFDASISPEVLRKIEKPPTEANRFTG